MDPSNNNNPYLPRFNNNSFLPTFSQEAKKSQNPTLPVNSQTDNVNNISINTFNRCSPFSENSNTLSLSDLDECFQSPKKPLQKNNDNFTFNALNQDFELFSPEKKPLKRKAPTSKFDMSKKSRLSIRHEGSLIPTDEQKETAYMNNIEKALPNLCVSPIKRSEKLNIPHNYFRFLAWDADGKNFEILVHRDNYYKLKKFPHQGVQHIAYKATPFDLQTFDNSKEVSPTKVVKIYNFIDDPAKIYKQDIVNNEIAQNFIKDNPELAEFVEFLDVNKDNILKEDGIIFQDLMPNSPAKGWGNATTLEELDSDQKKMLDNLVKMLQTTNKSLIRDLKPDNLSYHDNKFKIFDFTILNEDNERDKELNIIKDNNIVIDGWARYGLPKGSKGNSFIYDYLRTNLSN